MTASSRKPPVVRMSGRKKLNGRCKTQVGFCPFRGPAAPCALKENTSGGNKSETRDKALSLFRFVTSRDRGIDCVPLVFLLDQPQKLWDQWAAGVAVGHNDSAVSFSKMRGQVALESPIAAAVRKIPALALLEDAETHRVRSDSTRCDHLARDRPCEYT